MSGRRVLVLYGSLLLGFAVVLCRLFWLCSNTAYAARAEAQSTATLMFPARRGNFYDCNGHLLTGLGEQWLALSLPGEEATQNFTRMPARPVRQCSTRNGTPPGRFWWR